MSRSFHRRLRVLLASAIAGICVWRSAPGTDIDRQAFTAVAQSFINPPLFTAGHGSHLSPWQLRAFAMDSKKSTPHAPAIVSLGDDPDGFFQESPPAPIDLAVVLSNFSRLGMKKAATAAVLAWEKPDPIGLAALEKSLGKFESLTMAAPLSRGAVASPMPPAFRRASIPIAAVHGDASSLPVVNRIPLPGIILENASALAGFSVLESEPTDGPIPLLARWEDRLVFHFSILSVLQQHGLSVDHLDVRPGECLALGPNGPIVRIDDYGRLTTPLKPLINEISVPAESLIDAPADPFAPHAASPVILRDDRSAAEPTTRRFSESLSPLISAIESSSGLTEPIRYPRPLPLWEIALLAVTVLTLTLLADAPNFLRKTGSLVLAGMGIAAQWIGLGMAGIWLPGLAILATIAAAHLAGLRLANPPPSQS